MGQGPGHSRSSSGAANLPFPAPGGHWGHSWAGLGAGGSQAGLQQGWAWPAAGSDGLDLQGRESPALLSGCWAWPAAGFDILFSRERESPALVPAPRGFPGPLEGLADSEMQPAVGWPLWEMEESSWQDYLRLDFER